MEVTLISNGHDFSPVLSKYYVVHQPEFAAQFKTIDGRKHYVDKMLRTYIYFSVFPSAEYDTQDSLLCMEWPAVFEFSDKNTGTVRRMEFDLISAPGSAYLLHNVYGDNIYKTDEYRLEALEVDNASNIRNI